MNGTARVKNLQTGVTYPEPYAVKEIFQLLKRLKQSTTLVEIPPITLGIFIYSGTHTPTGIAGVDIKRDNRITWTKIEAGH